MDMIGNRALEPAAPVPPAVIEAFRGVAVAIVSDNMNRLHGTRSLRPFHGRGPLAGTAVTVKTRPGDNHALHRVLDLLRPGDVLVVDGAGSLDQALVGEIMMSRAQKLGAAGFVIDGAIRDVGAFARSGFPCFARGVTHRGPYKSGPGEINVPVAVDGLVVMPGDIVIGDEDGVVAFDRIYAGPLLEQVRRQEQREADALRAIAEDRFDNGYIGVGTPA